MGQTTSNKKSTKMSKEIDSSQDWSQLCDLSFRRRAQNRLSQRKHRQNVKQQREDESKNSTSQTNQTSSWRHNELVWVQPNAVSIKVQLKKQRTAESSKSPQQFTTTNSKGNPMSDVAHPTVYSCPTSLATVDATDMLVPSADWPLNLDGLGRMNVTDTDSLDHHEQLQVLQKENKLVDRYLFDSPRIHSDGSSADSLLDTTNLDWLLHPDDNISQGQMPPLDSRLANSSHTLLRCSPARDLSEDPAAACSPHDDAGDVVGYTSLHLAVQRNHLSIVKLLLESGVDVSTANGEGETALHLAASEGRLAVAKYLLEHHARPDSRNHKGQTVLHIAARKGDLELVALMLDYMIDLNIQDFGGQTALHMAVKAGHEDAVRLMIDRGVDMQAKVGWNHQQQARMITE